MNPEEKRTFIDNLFIRSWRPYFWFTIIIFLLYFQVLTFADFTYYDDHFLIAENFSYIDELSDAGHAFIEDVSHQGQGGNLYRPIFTLSLILSAQISGTGLFGYHLIDIILHITGCCLLYKVLQLLGFNRLLSFCAALIFCVHPAITQSIAWIAGRNDSLLAVFTLLCLITFIKFILTTSLRWYFAHLFFFFLAIFTKETSVIFPVIAVLYLCIFHRKKVFTISSILFLIGWGIILVNWNILRSAAMITPVGNKIQAAALVLSNMPIAFHYLGLIFWPINPAFAPVSTDITITAGIISFGFMLIAIFISKQKDPKLIIFGFVWFIAFLIPTFYYDPEFRTPPKFYEHRIYVPFMGILFIMLSFSFTYSKKLVKRIVPYIIIVLICGLGFISYSHTNNFRDSLNLREYDALTSPNDPKTHHNIAQMAVPEKLRLEIQTDDDVNTDTNKSQQLLTYKLRSVIKNLGEELESNPDDKYLYHALAVAQFGCGLFLSSEKSFLAAIKNDPDTAVIYYNLGILYYSARMKAEAGKIWLKSLQIDSARGETHLNLSYLYYETGYYDLAWLHCQKAEQLGIKVIPEFIKAIREKLQ